jgi:hypothetical protein
MEPLIEECTYWAVFEPKQAEGCLRSVPRVRRPAPVCAFGTGSGH